MLVCVDNCQSCLRTRQFPSISPPSSAANVRKCPSSWFFTFSGVLGRFGVSVVTMTRRSATDAPLLFLLLPHDYLLSRLFLSRPAGRVRAHAVTAARAGPRTDCVMKPRTTGNIPVSVMRERGQERGGGKEKESRYQTCETISIDPARMHSVGSTDKGVDT